MTNMFSMLAIALAILGLVAAQDQASSSNNPLAQYPTCAQTCVLNVYNTTTFCPDPRNQTCSCTSQGFNNAVSLCVSQTCTLKEALTAQNLTSVACGVEPLDRSKQLLAEVAGQLTVGGALILARVLFKVFDRSQSLWWDDYTLVFLFFFSGFPNMLITLILQIPAGLGVDVWSIPFDKITIIFKSSFFQFVLYFPQIAVLKLTFLFFFLRVFPGKQIQMVIKATMAICVAYGATFFFLAIFECTPVRYYWDWAQAENGKCADRNAINWASAIISIVLDVWMLCIPLWSIRDLRMPIKKKLGVASMFIVGTLVTVVCCVRLKYLNDFFHSTNPTQGLFDVIRWSTIEGFSSVACACMPTIRSMITKVYRPSSDGTTHNKSNFVSTFRSTNRKMEDDAWIQLQSPGSAAVVSLDDSRRGHRVESDKVRLTTTVDVVNSSV